MGGSVLVDETRTRPSGWVGAHSTVYGGFLPVTTVRDLGGAPTWGGVSQSYSVSRPNPDGTLSSPGPVRPT